MLATRHTKGCLCLTGFDNSFLLHFTRGVLAVAQTARLFTSVHFRNFRISPFALKMCAERQADRQTDRQTVRCESSGASTS